MNKKYELFIQLLNFNKEKYSAEKVFKDLVAILAITLSNKVYFNQENHNILEKIYKQYDDSERFNFNAMGAELVRLFSNENDPYDILGDIYQEITNKNYLKLLNNRNCSMQEVGKKLQGIININKKSHNGKMFEVNCGSGAMILAYASTLRMFKLDYKLDLDITAIDFDITNVFMTYIQMYFYEISAVVILIDEKSSKEKMRLYTPDYDNGIENLMVA